MNFYVGKFEYSLPEQDDFHLAVCELIQEEERRVLALREYGVKADEDILIHLVRMYILRWSIPALEIESTGNLNPTLSNKIRNRFWLCMFGRAVDDLADQDSRFFSTADSIILLTCYAGLLNLQNETDFGAEVLRRTNISLEVPSIENETLEFGFTQIQSDVCRRIRYFLSLSDVGQGKANLVERYAGVLLGKCDLDDCLADGANGPASTLISRILHRSVADPEGKIHFNQELVKWHGAVNKSLCDEAASLISDLYQVGASYAASILEAELYRWNSGLR